jgi:hypothetical protein
MVHISIGTCIVFILNGSHIPTIYTLQQNIDRELFSTFIRCLRRVIHLWLKIMT